MLGSDVGMFKHREWRKIAKKTRRKRIRKAAAAIRDKEDREREEKLCCHPQYKAWLAEQEALELFQEQEERLARSLAHQAWELAENVAQEKWAKRQTLLVEEERKRKEQEALIRREWEREQEKERIEKEKKEKEEAEKRLQYERLMDEMDSFIEGSGAKPESLYTSLATNPDKEPCPFYSKVGACRFKNNCSRNHVKPAISNTLLIPGFYSHFALDVGIQDEYDTDINLEYDSSDRYMHFREFFADIAPELERFGKIHQLRVCTNTEPHLRGNVYVSYVSERSAAAAYKALAGRYYASKMLTVEFVEIQSWKQAICGLQFRGACPKGNKCNFLHVFRNPRDMYCSMDAPNRKRSPEERNGWGTPSPDYDRALGGEGTPRRNPESGRRKERERGKRRGRRSPSDDRSRSSGSRWGRSRDRRSTNRRSRDRRPSDRRSREKYRDPVRSRDGPERGSHGSVRSGDKSRDSDRTERKSQGSKRSERESYDPDCSERKSQCSN